MRIMALCTVLLLAVGTTPDSVWAGSNFTMLDKVGGGVGGNNNTRATWNGSLNNTVNGTNFNMTLQSNSKFLGFRWTAHNVRVFGPGTYTFNADCTIAEIQAGTLPANCAAPAVSLPLTMTVGPNQIGAHMLFDWNNSINIDVVNVWDQNTAFGPSISIAPGFAGAPAPDANTVYRLTSTDNDGDGVIGVQMVDGPFKQFNANFNVSFASGCTGCSDGSASAPNTAGDTQLAGCSINPTPVELSARPEWWLLAGFLVWLGIVRRRVKQRVKA